MRGFTIVTMLALLGACSSAPKGQQQADKLNSAVQKIGDGFAAAESNLRVTMEAYSKLLNAEGDLKAPYKAFADGVKKGEKLLADLQAQLIKADAAAATYFQTYEKDLEAITDEGVREQSRARLETRRSSYSEFQKHLKEGLDNYGPITEKLRAHADALGLELTAASVAGIKQHSEEVVKLANEWYKRDEGIKADVKKFLEQNASSTPVEESAEKPAKS